LSDPQVSWAERAAERSPSVQRSRTRSVQQAKVIVDAARRVIRSKGDNFTTQDLVKEAGVALQTFYRYFAGKDQLLLAVIEDMIAEFTVVAAAQAEDMPDPVDRLRSYITTVLAMIDDQPEFGVNAGWVTSEHWRLHRLFPDELSHATKPFTDLLLVDIRAAAAEGLLRPNEPERDAWFIAQLVMSVFHYYAYASHKDGDVAEDLWRFCLAALGGETTERRRPPARSRRR
jgi:AcrR family transcriptional regulator